MQLSEFFKKEQIIRNNWFDTFGLINTKPEGLKILTFVENEKYFDGIEVNRCISAILTTPEFGKVLAHRYPDIGIAVVEVPKRAFAQLHNDLADNVKYIGKSIPTKIGNDCKIAPTAVIASQNVIIGNRVIIEDNVVIKKGVTIGDDSIIRSGCVIGGEGFEFKRFNDGIFPVKHVGKVLIRNRVEIQQLTNIARAVYPWDATTIDDDSKIDALVHIAHSVKIGKSVLIVSHAGIGGSTMIEDDVWIGFGAIVSNSLHIGKHAKISIGSVVTKDIPAGEIVSGNFAINHQLFLKNLKSILSENTDKK